MAQTPEQNRRYQAALRRVLARLRAEQPDTYRAWLDEALADLDANGTTLTETAKSDPALVASVQQAIARPRSEGVKVRRRQLKPHEGERWNGYRWVPNE